jgi:hypothetical protein
MSKAIQSKAFPNAYLRIDGTDVSAPTSGGGGTVNCQSGVADFETIEERPQPDGTIAFASVSFPNVFLRMDSSGVKCKYSALMISAGRLLPVGRMASGVMVGQGRQAGAGSAGIQGRPVSASRSAVILSRPCLAAVET